MSAEPKRVELTEIVDGCLPYGGILRSAARHNLLQALEGWVSPEEATAREVAAEQAGREDNALHDMCYVSGSKALEAREAAARREALLEAADWIAEAHPNVRGLLCAAMDIRGFAEVDVVDMADTIARIEARLDEESPCLDRHLGAMTCDHPGCVLERDIRGILAEPERDEEGGND